MPYWSSNNPADFGWTAPPLAVVPFVYRGHAFPQGVDRRVVTLFTRALDRLCAEPGFELHSGSGLGDGDWGYEHRAVTGGGTLSFHAFGLALDLNAPWNPYGAALPEASPYRLPRNTGELVRPLGLLWGGGPEFGLHRDWMHLECHLTPGEVDDKWRPGHPATVFPLPTGHCFGRVADQWTVNGSAPCPVKLALAIEFVQDVLGTLSDGLYGPITEAAVIRFQRGHALVPDGLVGPRTWAKLG